MLNGHHDIHPTDLDILDFLTGPKPPKLDARIKRRDEDLDPLLLAASAGYTSVTRNHYTHDFFPAVMDPTTQGSWDFKNWSGEQMSAQTNRPRLAYVSRQAPRSTRSPPAIPADTPRLLDMLEIPTVHLSASGGSTPDLSPAPTALPTPSASTDDLVSRAEGLTLAVSAARPAEEDVIVKCMARTRIPTPHGPAFLHLYHNNRDGKEHLAIVIDPAQLSEADSPMHAPAIRSASLDAVWSANESPMDRITRGAYVGRLAPGAPPRPSVPASSSNHARPLGEGVSPPLIRIHSECFTGETIGSMRCDCGEQLDEALRLIARPSTFPNGSGRLPGRGAVVYLRQEGRGIGLLSKIRAYNLQDLGHDTVQANLLLGHGADERRYDVAAAILRDLGLGGSEGEGVRLLTNNPDKVAALASEGLRVVERVPMVPRSWRRKQQPHRHTHANPLGVHGLPALESDDVRIAEDEEEEEALERASGATLIGGGAAHGEDLDKYLRTKVLRMGHMLPLSAFPERKAA